MRARTDRHNNPMAFTTGIAKQAGLALGLDYEEGDPFKDSVGRTYYTARLLEEPIEITIRVIDAIGFLTAGKGRRWAYIEMSRALWHSLSPDMKRWVIGHCYHHEGGTGMKGLFTEKA